MMIAYIFVALVILIGYIIYTTSTPKKNKKNVDAPTASTTSDNTPTGVAPKVEDNTPTVTFYSNVNNTGTSKTLPLVMNVKYSPSQTSANLCGDASYQIGFTPQSLKFQNVSPEKVKLTLMGNYGNRRDTGCGPSSGSAVLNVSLMAQLFTEPGKPWNNWVKDNAVSDNGAFIFSNA